MAEISADAALSASIVSAITTVLTPDDPTRTWVEISLEGSCEAGEAKVRRRQPVAPPSGCPSDLKPMIYDASTQLCSHRYLCRYFYSNSCQNVQPNNVCMPKMRHCRPPAHASNRHTPTTPEQKKTHNLSPNPSLPPPPPNPSNPSSPSGNNVNNKSLLLPPLPSRSRNLIVLGGLGGMVHCTWYMVPHDTS